MVPGIRVNNPLLAILNEYKTVTLSRTYRPRQFFTEVLANGGVMVGKYPFNILQNLYDDSESIDDYERKIPLLISIFLFGVPLWLFIYLIAHWIMAFWTIIVWTQ